LLLRPRKLLVLVIVFVNDFEMETTGYRPYPVSADSTLNSSHNTNAGSSSYKGRAAPKCARCRIHGKSTPVKNHKGICAHRECDCVHCYVVAKGRMYRALQLRKWREDEKKLRETGRDTSAETDSDRFGKTATPSAPGNDSNALAKNDAVPPLHGCFTSNNPSVSPTPNAIRNKIRPLQLQQPLTRRYHQYLESYTPLNAAATRVEERRESPPSTNFISGKMQPVVPSDLQNNPFSAIPPEQLSYWPPISSMTQPIVPTEWMANLAISPAPNAIRNINHPPQLQHRLIRRYHPYLKSNTPLNAAATIVEKRRESLSSSNFISGKIQPVVPSNLQNNPFSATPPEQTRYWPQISSITHANVPPAWMTNHSTTIPLPQSTLQLSIPCGERFTHNGPITTAAALVSDLCSIKSGSDSLSSSGSTSGRTLPNDPGTCTNIDSSITQQSQQHLQFPPACCHIFTDYAPQPQDETTVPNVPNVCMYAPGGTVPPPNTDFHSIDSLSSSSISQTSRTQPVKPGACVNVGLASIPARQPLKQPSQRSCENFSSYGTSGTSYYDTLIWQYGLNLLF
jgi:hypothetical protein